MKMTLYGVMILCYVVAGVMDVADGELKAGVVAWMFAAANAVIFFWR